MISNPRIIFFGTPQFAATILEALVKSSYKPVLAVTAPDKPVGRKQKMTPPSVKVLAEKHGIPVVQPETLREDTRYKMQNANPDLFVVAAYGKIISQDMLSIPAHGSINVHPSLLPNLRGASPIQGAILEGLLTTGVTIMQMDEKMDHGPILTQAKIPLNIDGLTAEELSQKLAQRGAELLIETIPRYLKGEITPQEQAHKEATYTKLITKKDGHIDWGKSAEYIERQIRAYTPWPGTYAYWNERQLNLLAADVVNENEDHTPGTVYALGDMFAIACGRGALVPRELKLAGKSPAENKTFRQGYPAIIDSVLT